MVDYAKLSATATRLITKNGRVINLVRKELTPDDPAKPWDGTADPDTLTPISAVFVPPNTVREFGLTALGQGTEFNDLIASSQQIVILNPVLLDLRDYTSMIDSGGERWGIIGIQVLKPGDTQLLGFLGVRR
jgi:hypothetical protein